MSHPPLVSVIIPAYNLQEIVGRAIESALEQTTSFEYEIIVADDCSTDNTREVALEYARRNPERVRVICHAKNLKLQRNVVSLMKASQARYIAYLDADDYWTDRNKLQKQVTFLEQNPEYSATTHNVRTVLLSGEVVDPFYPGLPEGRRLPEDLVRECFVPTPSIVFKNTLSERVPEWSYDSQPHDWPLWMVLIQDGPFMHFENVMADYTLHPQSMWSSRGRVYQCGTEIELYRRWRSLLPVRYRRLVRACEATRHEWQSRALMKEGNWPAARMAALRAATTADWRDRVKDKTRIVLDAFLPALMGSFRKAKGIQ